MDSRKLTRGIFAAALMLAAVPAISTAASHSDAPLSKQDPQTNITDVYAFMGSRYDDPARQVLNVVVAVRPFSEPGDGPHYDRFADDARYRINITDPGTGDIQTVYEFRFSPVNEDLKNPDTILSYGLGTEAGPIGMIGDARQNFTQTYTVRRITGDDEKVLASDLVTGLPNPGSRVTPLYNDPNGRAVSGAVTFADLDPYTKQAIHDLPGGEAVFAGPRDDGFYADVPGIFDLLNVRILDNNGNLSDGLGQDGGGVDGFKGFNVLTYVIQIPVESLRPKTFQSPFFGTQKGVGVFGSVLRPRTRSIDADGRRRPSGPYVQINRMGNPLFNEVFVALRDKDLFNVRKPANDGNVFAKYALNPELAGLINFVFGTSNAGTGRTDLAAIFIPDVLRVVTNTGPVPVAGQAGFNRLGFIGGDLTSGVSSGWPNGRRLGDDVVDIALTALVSGPTYSTITVVGDNVSANDEPYNQVFPYSATPHSGTNNLKDH